MMEQLQARSNVYKMVSVVVSYPDERVCASFVDEQWRRGLQKSLSLLDASWFAGCFEDFRTACSEDSVGSPATMSLEYERLFGNPLFEGNDVAESRGCMRTVWFFLRDKKLDDENFCDDFDRVFPQTGRPLADLLRHRFKLMGILAELESKSKGLAKIDLEEMQLDFTSRFIAPAIPAFCEEIIRNSSLEFYRAAGILIREFIKFEENYLGIPEELDTS